MNVIVCNDIKGPWIQNFICNSIEIKERPSPLSTKYLLKIYKIKDVSKDDKKPFNGIRTLFIEPIGCSQNLEESCSDTINDSDFPSCKKIARSALKCMDDDAFQMADDVEEEGVKKLESSLKEFRSWCNKKRTETNTEREENFANDDQKKKYVPMTNDKYTSNVKRVFKTHHMQFIFNSIHPW